ncbi:M15 family metallopeptidase [Pseudorhodoferax sp.]|uniref:M15 family metallopeptidase n=1 Tax=Pseudorhodoferax sp. TaxID=1993553 RepID=UPI0039E47C9E
MLFLAAAVYVLLVSALAARLAMPGLWQRVRERAAWRLRPWAAAAARIGLRASARWVCAAAVVLAAVPAATLWLRDRNAYDGYDHTASRGVNPQVARLLEGENLVPPAPLPPELFMTRELERARPAIATASRQWELLDAEFRSRLLAVYQVMRDQHGYEMVLLEGYRSPERQAELAALGPTVTYATAGASYHQYGLAADSAFIIDGRIVISEQDPRAARGYALYGAVAQSAGLVWGGSWRSLKDLGHVELRRPGVLRRTEPARPPA